jgi:thioredoxin 1
MINHTNDLAFDTDVLQAEQPVLVDFWADWCGPCLQIAPVLEEISKEYGDRLQIMKLNIDENTIVADQFGVRGIPTLLLFKDGELIGTQVGAGTKTRLVEFLESHI